MSNNNVKSLIKLTQSDAVVGRFKELLKEQAPKYITSMINTVKASKTLMQCDQQKLLGEVFKAATLNLPIEPAIGHACIVPFKSRGEYIPTFIIQVKGWIQLAQRSGQIKDLNVATVYADEIEKYNPVLEKITFKKDIPEDGQRFDGKSEPAGYYADLELINGFKKQIYWTRQRVMKHAIQYVPSWDKKNKCFYKNSFWDTNFDEQGEKTVLRQLLSRWSPISTDLLGAIRTDETIIDDQRESAPENTRPEAPKAPKTPKPNDKDVIDNNDDDKDDDPFS